MTEHLGWRTLSTSLAKKETEEDITVTVEDIRIGVNKMANLKAEGQASGVTGLRN